MSGGGPPPKGELRVIVDGVPLPPEEARAFWGRFSAHLDAEKGDLAGFAAREGFASVRPAVEGGRPVLLVSRTEAQTPYADASRVAKAPKGPRPRR